MKGKSVVFSLDMEENVAFVKNTKQDVVEWMEQFQCLVVVYLEPYLKLLGTWRHKLLTCLWWYSRSKVHSLINFLCQNVSLNRNCMQIMSNPRPITMAHI